MTTTPDTAAALTALRDCWADIVGADSHACTAIEHLSEARRTRAAAVLRRVRVRMVDAEAAEVFATYAHG